MLAGPLDLDELDRRCGLVGIVAAERKTPTRTARARARRSRNLKTPPHHRRPSPTFVAVGVAAHAHLIVRMGFGVLPIIPIVQAKATLPGLATRNFCSTRTGFGKSWRAATLDRQ